MSEKNISQLDCKNYILQLHIITMKQHSSRKEKPFLLFFCPKGGMPRQEQEINTMKGVSTMKGLEIAVIIIGCGIKILEVLEES